MLSQQTTSSTVQAFSIQKKVCTGHFWFWSQVVVALMFNLFLQRNIEVGNWSSGMIRALGAWGPVFDSPIAPAFWVWWVFLLCCLPMFFASCVFFVLASAHVFASRVLCFGCSPIKWIQLFWRLQHSIIAHEQHYCPVPNRTALQVCAAKKAVLAVMCLWTHAFQVVAVVKPCKYVSTSVVHVKVKADWCSVYKQCLSNPVRTVMGCACGLEPTLTEGVKLGTCANLKATIWSWPISMWRPAKACLKVQQKVSGVQDCQPWPRA